MGEDRVVIAHRLILISMLTAALAACSAGSGTVRGVVLSVDGDLQTVTGFTLLVEGDEMSFVPVDDGDYAFPLAHLREHQRTGEPVLVGWESIDGRFHALSVDDG